MTDMAGQEMNYYILFETYTQGMALQKLLREENISSRISPAPRSIQGKLGCGMAILISDKEELEKAKDCIERHLAPYYAIRELPCQINPRRDRYC